MRNPTAFTSQKTTLYQAVGRPLEPDVTHGFSGRGKKVSDLPRMQLAPTEIDATP